MRASSVLLVVSVVFLSQTARANQFESKSHSFESVLAQSKSKQERPEAPAKGKSDERWVEYDADAVEMANLLSACPNEVRTALANGGRFSGATARFWRGETSIALEVSRGGLPPLSNVQVVGNLLIEKRPVPDPRPVQDRPTRYTTQCQFIPERNP